MSDWKTLTENTTHIPLTLGLFADIDTSDEHLVSGCSWQARHRRDKKGYYAVSSSGIRMHRLILGVYDSRIVDHKDGNGLNNKRNNIRPGTQSQNCVNRRTTPGLYLRGTRPKNNKWQAYIKYKGKQRSLGYCITEIEAHEAYISEAIKMHGDWMPLPEAPKQ